MNKVILSLSAAILTLTLSNSYAQDNKLEYCPTVNQINTIDISPTRYMFDGYNSNGAYFYSDIIEHKPGGIRSWPEFLDSSKYNETNHILKCRYYSYSSDAPWFVMKGEI